MRVSPFIVSVISSNATLYTLLDRDFFQLTESTQITFVINMLLVKIALNRINGRSLKKAFLSLL